MAGLQSEDGQFRNCLDCEEGALHWESIRRIFGFLLVLSAPCCFSLLGIVLRHPGCHGVRLVMLIAGIPGIYFSPKRKRRALGAGSLSS